MNCSCTGCIINGFHNKGMREYRYFVKRSSEVHKEIEPYYCNEYNLENIPVGAKVVDLKNTDANEPYIVSKSEIGLFEFYRNPNVEYINENIINEHLVEKVFKDGVLSRIIFNDVNSEGFLLYNSNKNELLIQFRNVVFASYDDVSYIGWPDELQELEKCKITGKYKIDDHLLPTILNALRKKVNAGRFDLIDNLINKRFTFDKRYVKYKE